MFRNVFAVVGLLLGLVGAVFFAASGVLIWSVRKDVDQQATALAARANDAADAADHAVGYVYEILDQATSDLQITRKQLLEQPAQQINPFVQFTARQATQQLAGSVDRVSGAVVTASDAVVVADAAMDVISRSDELKRLLGVSPDQMFTTRHSLEQATNELRRARSVLGITVSSVGDGLSEEQLNAVDRALSQARGFADEMAKVVATVRNRVNDTKQEVNVWAWRGALATTIICAWATVGQLFLARFCWRTLRGQPA